MIFHRWTALSLISALVGRQVYYPFGHSRIYPNQYILLTGSPGSRKGSAIKTGTALLKELEFKYFAPNRAAKEALWEWLAKQSQNAEVDEWIDDVIGEADDSFISQAYIATDEFLDFIGMGDDGLMTNLTNLWDNLDRYVHPKTRSRDIIVPNPTINILSGITPGGIAEAFRGLATSGGFFSRIMFVFSHPTNIKITFPSPPNKSIKDDLISRLYEISKIQGEVRFPSDVQDFLDTLYKSSPNIPDGRFSYYMQRRFSHLIKLITVLALSDLTLRPTLTHAILANTILAVAEHQMPNAIGEYGKAKHAEVANKVVELINHSDSPLSVGDMWKTVSRDLDKMSLLQDILQNLLAAERIQKTAEKGRILYLGYKANRMRWDPRFVDYSLLHPHEHNEDTGDYEDENVQRSC